MLEPGCAGAADVADGEGRARRRPVVRVPRGPWLGLCVVASHIAIAAPKYQAGRRASPTALRSAKARVKALLGSFGILRLTRSLFRALDHSYAWRASPTHAWGEQLVVVARRRPDIT